MCPPAPRGAGPALSWKLAHAGSPLRNPGCRRVLPFFSFHVALLHPLPARYSLHRTPTFQPNPDCRPHCITGLVIFTSTLRVEAAAMLDTHWAPAHALVGLRPLLRLGCAVQGAWATASQPTPHCRVALPLQRACPPWTLTSCGCSCRLSLQIARLSWPPCVGVLAA